LILPGRVGLRRPRQAGRVAPRAPRTWQRLHSVASPPAKRLVYRISRPLQNRSAEHCSARRTSLSQSCRARLGAPSAGLASFAEVSYRKYIEHFTRTLTQILHSSCSWGMESSVQFRPPLPFNSLVLTKVWWRRSPKRIPKRILDSLFRHYTPTTRQSSAARSVSPRVSLAVNNAWFFNGFHPAIFPDFMAEPLRSSGRMVAVF
jgi:hypothetical protein